MGLGRPFHRGQDAPDGLQAYSIRRVSDYINVTAVIIDVVTRGEPTIFVDENGTAYAFRSDIVKWFNEPFPNKNRRKTLSHAISGESLQYIHDCGPRPHEDIVANNRGDQWYNVIGTDRQNKEVSHNYLYKSVTDLAVLLEVPRPYSVSQEIQGPDRLVAQGGWPDAKAHVKVFPLLPKCTHLPETLDSEIAARIFQQRFPNLAARVDNCAASLLAQGPKFAEFAIPLFRYWYNYCINGPNLQYGVDGVFTRPHVDGKNVALMMCVVFVWGVFISSWLQYISQISLQVTSTTMSERG